MGADIRWVDSARSTNSLLARDVSALPHGAVVAARRQTAGRGQRGNSWESEPDANLTFSMLLRPSVIAAAAQFELSMVVALSVCDSLAEASAMEFKVKWPNDIYCGDKKICGILIENSLEGRHIARSIVGIGINVNQRRFISDAPNPVSLVNLTGHTFDLGCLLVDVCDRLLSRLAAYEASPDPCRLVGEYRARLWRGTDFHRWLDAASGEIFEAAVDDVAVTGMLTLTGRDGCRRTYAFKEVAAVL